MQQAIEEANKAKAIGEVPIGAVKKSSSVLTSKSQIDILNVYQSKLSFGTLIQ